MTKLVIRYFIICVVMTIILSVSIFDIYKIMVERNTLANLKLLTDGTFYSLDKYIKHYPENRWQTILKNLKPTAAGIINIIPINQLSLNKDDIEKLQHNEIIYEANELADNETIVYKKIDHSHYAYQYLLDFNSEEKAKRLYGWAPILVINELNKMGKNKWPEFLKEESKYFGYPISISSLINTHLLSSKKEMLSHGRWVVDLPNHSDDSIQMLYVPLNDKSSVLVFGPIRLPLLGVYQTYIIFVLAFLFVEVVIFIFAILFAKSLERLNKLSMAYGQGQFTYPISLNKTSTLYPLFINLRKMGNQIQNLIQSQKDLVNSISHELRTPLSQLEFRIELLKKQSENHDQLNAMEEDINELDQLISEQLFYAKLDYINYAQEIEKHSLDEIIQTSIENFAKLPVKKTLKVNFPTDLQHTYIDANKPLILRSLKNLLENANRFAESTVQLAVMRIDNIIQVNIEDDGPGIILKDREKIFEPFQQLSNQHFHKGIGLGLAIVKKIVNQHGWSISVEDSKLGGAKFVISINQKNN